MELSREELRGLAVQLGVRADVLQLDDRWSAATGATALVTTPALTR